MIVVRKGLLLVAVMFAICAGSSVTSTISPLELELHVIETQIRILFRFIAKDCPPSAKFKREINNAVDHNRVKLQIQQQLYADMLKTWHDCQGKNVSKSGNDLSTRPTDSAKSTLPASKERTTTPTINLSSTIRPMQVTTVPRNNTTSTTTKGTSTTTVTLPGPNTVPWFLLPEECRRARSYTESWRLDHKGSDYKPGGLFSSSGYACDFTAGGSRWFRFSGAAGNKMLDSCPKEKSCGTRLPFWTDDTMPVSIGLAAEVNVYGVYGNSCHYFVRKMKVMRCSWRTNHDFIYHLENNFATPCQGAFCGMVGR